MNDKTQREHNRSAFGCIVTKAPLALYVEPDCGAVIQLDKSGALGSILYVEASHLALSKTENVSDRVVFKPVRLPRSGLPSRSRTDCRTSTMIAPSAVR